MSTKQTEYPNQWNPIIDPHRALHEAMVTIGFVRDRIKEAKGEEREWMKAMIAVSALEWVENNLDQAFSESWERHCERRQELAEQIMKEHEERPEPGCNCMKCTKARTSI